MTACLKCHNSNHVGADFVGLFEKDYDRGFRSPFVQGRQAPRIYGAEQHALLRDAHFRAGMQCSDCHLLEEIHGSGDIPDASKKTSRISCEGCHVTGTHPAILTDAEGKRMLLRGAGRAIPPMSPRVIPHSIPEHRAKLKCSACHAAWSFQDYGLHLMREERADYWKWSLTAALNDPQAQELLMRNVGTEVELIQPPDGPKPAKPEEDWSPPVSRDYLNGETRPGIWFHGFTERTWSRSPLGMDGAGRVSVMRPMFQYVVSQTDREGTAVLNSHVPRTGGGFPALLWTPYSPHTIAKPGRACSECHMSPKAVGLGDGVFTMETHEFKPIRPPEDQVPGHSFRWDALVDQSGRALQWSSYPNAGPLAPEIVRTLLNPSPRFRALHFRFLTPTD
jgi:hypothetical protein